MSSFSALFLFTLLFVATQSAVGSEAHQNFFNKLSVDKRNEVSAIVNSQLTKGEIREKLQHWVSTQPSDTQTAFATAEKRLEEYRQRIHVKHQKILARVSDKAKEVHNKILQIHKDQSITKQETCLQVLQLFISVSDAVKKELKLKKKECNH